MVTSRRIIEIILFEAEYLDFLPKLYQTTNFINIYCNMFDYYKLSAQFAGVDNRMKSAATYAFWARKLYRWRIIMSGK